MDAIADDVWQLAAPDFRLPGGIYIPAHCTLVRLPDRSLLIYSPLDFSDADAAAIDALGEVAHLVAPNLLHHLYMSKAAARWPKATIHGAPGLAEKRPELAIHKTLGEGEALRDTFDILTIDGSPKLRETVMFHRPTGSLIVADLLFNVGQPRNLRTRWILSMIGLRRGHLSQSFEWSRMTKDRPAARASIERLLEWPIQRVIPCHGAALPADPTSLRPALKRLVPSSTSSALDTATTSH